MCVSWVLGFGFGIGVESGRDERGMGKLRGKCIPGGQYRAFAW